MIRIGNDVRQAQSARLICEGLLRLIAQKPYNAITVAALAEEAGVGRATFYRLFDSKEDAVLFCMERVFDELLRKLPPGCGARGVMTALLDVWLAQKPLFLALLEAGLYERFQTLLAKIVEEKLLFLREAWGFDARGWHYFVQIRAGMFFAALRVAIVDYPQDAAEDIFAAMGVAEHGGARSAVC
jgi:AcrR family transcriptional regulator